VISFSDEVKIHQEFTGNPDFVIHALRMLHKEGDGAHMLDALRQALLMLHGVLAAIASSAASAMEPPASSLGP
jgi:hypothetical protein